MESNQNSPRENTLSDGQKIGVTIEKQSNAEVTLSLKPEAQVNLILLKLDHEGKTSSIKKKQFTNQRKNNRSVFINYVKKLNSSSGQAILLGAALVIYLLIRFIGLDSYPIFFFTDEAVQTVLASDLVNNNFRDYQQELLPTFFVNGGQYNLGTSVYLQVLPWMMFGKSIWVTRGVSVLISLLAALAVGLAAKKHFNLTHPFMVVMLLSITPAWFLHSRTAFETVIAVSFYAAFLFFYLNYRSGKTKCFYLAVVFGMLSFYSYSPAQMVVAGTAILLLVSDWKIHKQNWKVVLVGVGLGLLLAIPYFRFLILHPGENKRHLEIVNSYWIQAVPFIEKLKIYFSTYLRLLDPRYWFIPNTVDLERHVMKEYGHLIRWSLPIFLLGLGITGKRIKDGKYRVLLIALLAAPSGAALATAGITRTLFMVIPAALITALGFEQIFKWIEKLKVPRTLIAAFTFLGLGFANFFILADALINAPTWYSNYSLNGQQYGAKQIFTEIHSMLEENPNQSIYFSPSWANGTDTLAKFFFNGPLPFDFGSIEAYLMEKRDIPENQVFILIPEEMEMVNTSGKLTLTKLIKIIPYPNGKPGFYIVKLRYVDNIDEVIAEEFEARQKLLESGVTTPDGQHLTVRYSLLDIGYIQDVFDGNSETLARTFQANPMKLEIRLDEPRDIQEISVRIGGAPTTVNVFWTQPDGSQSETMQQIVEVSTEFRDIVFALEKPQQMKEIYVYVYNTNDSEPSHVHVWDVNFR